MHLTIGSLRSASGGEAITPQIADALALATNAEVKPHHEVIRR